VDFTKSEKYADYVSKKSWLNSESDPEHILDTLSYAVVDCCEKRAKLRKTSYILRWSAGKFRLVYLLHAGNDAVPISVWRGVGIRSLECRLL